MDPWIGLCGHGFAGKDTVADWLADNHGYNKTWTSKPLHEGLKILDPWIPQWDYESTHVMFGGPPSHAQWLNCNRIDSYKDYTELKKIPEVRRLLQQIGDVYRHFWGGEVVTHMAMEGVPTPATITGLRYPFELDIVHDLGGKVYWVDRGGKPVNEHPVENSLTPKMCDGVIDNMGSIEDLYVNLRSLWP